jgi:hypothetical protein
MALILLPWEEPCWPLWLASLGTEADDASTAAEST